MSKEDDNKAIIGRWVTNFWGKTCNLDIVDELAAPDMLLQYSLHAPRRGREVRIPTMPSGHTELKASTYSDLMPSTFLR
jgi:hypothetical protein